MGGLTGVYAGRIVSLGNGNANAYIPQVFGDVTVTICDFLGVPEVGRGYVTFEAGDAEHPVWLSGAGTGTGTVEEGSGVSIFITRDYRWVNQVTASDPGGGRVKVNNLDPALATEIYISDYDVGASAFITLLTLRAGDLIAIYLGGDVGTRCEYTLRGPAVHAGSWLTIPVTVSANHGFQSGTPGNNDSVKVTVQTAATGGPQGPAGPVGPVGPAGPTGATGSQGPIGLTGAKGDKGDQGIQGVKGDTGATGPAGVSGAPIGFVGEYINTTAPTGWLAMIGQAIVNADTLYPVLWSVVPAAMKSGTTLTMPDTRGRVSVGYSSGDARFNAIGPLGTAGASGGFYDAIVPTHEHWVGDHYHFMGDHTHTMADHTHTMQHQHGVGVNDQTGTVSADHAHGVGMDGAGQHGHGWGHGSVFYYDNSGSNGVPGGPGYAIAGATWLHDGNHAHNTWTGGINTNHTHQIGNAPTYVGYYNATHGGGLNDAYMKATHGGNVSTTWMSTVHTANTIPTVTNTAQTAVTNRNLQPYVTLLKIIRAL